MLTLAFWNLTIIRAVKTFAQALVAILGADAAALLHAGWPTALSTAGLAAVMSVLTTLSSVGSDAPTPIAQPASGPPLSSLSDGRNPLDTV